IHNLYDGINNIIVLFAKREHYVLKFFVLWGICRRSAIRVGGLHRALVVIASRRQRRRNLPCARDQPAQALRVAEAMTGGGPLDRPGIQW
ncbi:MAG: hypothetical protein ACK44M_13825, partial [Chloroflexus sp.]